MQIHYEKCATEMRGMCYVVYMQRADLHRMFVYVPLDTTTPTYYSVSTVSAAGFVAGSMDML